MLQSKTSARSPGPRRVERVEENARGTAREARADGTSRSGRPDARHGDHGTPAIRPRPLPAADDGSGRDRAARPPRPRGSASRSSQTKTPTRSTPGAAQRRASRRAGSRRDAARRSRREVEPEAAMRRAAHASATSSGRVRPQTLTAVIAAAPEAVSSGSSARRSVSPTETPRTRRRRGARRRRAIGSRSRPAAPAPAGSAGASASTRREVRRERREVPRVHPENVRRDGRGPPDLVGVVRLDDGREASLPGALGEPRAARRPASARTISRTASAPSETAKSSCALRRRRSPSSGPASPRCAWRGEASRRGRRSGPPR